MQCKYKAYTLIYQIILKTINPVVSDSQNMFNENIKKRMIGVAPKGEVVTLELGFFDSLLYAYEKTIFASTMIFQGVQKLISGVIPSSEIGGVITIGKVISDASESSLIALLTITALISVNLGVLNLLPIPALDGGHIMFLVFEAVNGGPLSRRKLEIAQRVGMSFLFALIFIALFNDVARLF